MDERVVSKPHCYRLVYSLWWMWITVPTYTDNTTPIISDPHYLLFGWPLRSAITDQILQVPGYCQSRYTTIFLAVDIPDFLWLFFSTSPLKHNSSAGTCYRKLRDTLATHIKDSCFGMLFTNKKLTGYCTLQNIITPLCFFHFSDTKQISLPEISASVPIWFMVS